MIALKMQILKEFAEKNRSWKMQKQQLHLSSSLTYIKYFLCSSSSYGKIFFRRLRRTFYCFKIKILTQYESESMGILFQNIKSENEEQNKNS